MGSRILKYLIAILIPAILYAQPQGEIDPRSIWLNGTKTTTASIPFAQGLSSTGPATFTVSNAATVPLAIYPNASQSADAFQIFTRDGTSNLVRAVADPTNTTTRGYLNIGGLPTLIVSPSTSADKLVIANIADSTIVGGNANNRAIFSTAEFTGTSAYVGNFNAGSFTAGTQASSTGNLTAPDIVSGGLIGGLYRIRHNGTGTVTGASAIITGIATGTSSGPITDATAVHILAATINGTASTNIHAIRIRTQVDMNTSVTANWYGIRIGEQLGTANIYPIMLEGANKLFWRDSSTYIYSPSAGNLTVAGALTLGTAYFGNGTAAAPSIAFASDTNTGIYRTGADALGVSAGGVLQTTTSTIGLTIANTLNVNATSDFAQATRVDYNYGYALSNLSAGIPGGLIGDTGSSELMQFAINTSQAESSLAVFGYAVNTSTQGGLFRFDTRSGFPIFTIGFQDNQDNLGGGSGIQYAAIQLSGSQGRLGLGTGHAFDTDTYYGTVDISPKTNEVALYVRQEPAAGADITQWVNTAGAVRAYIDKSWNFSTTGDIFAGGSVTATTSVIGAKGYFNGNATNTLLVEQNGVRNNTLIVDTTNGTVGMLGAASTTVGVSIPQTTYGTSLGLTRTLSSKVNPAASFVINDTLSWTGASNYTHQLASLTLFDSRNVTSSAGVDTVSAMTMSYTSSATTVGATNNLRGISKIVNDTRTYNRSAGNTTVIAAADLLNASFSPIYNDGAAGRTLNYTGSASNMSMNVGGTLTSGTINSTLYGAYMAYGNSGPTVTSGTWNMILPAYYAGGSVTATGVNSSGYGFFYEMSGQDFDWGYFNNSANPNYMGKDNSKSWWGTNTNSGVLSATNQLTSGDASVYYDGTNFVINPKEVGTGLLQILGNLQLSNATPSITLTDSGGDDYIIDVGSTASLLRIRNTTDGTNAFQVDGNGNTAISTSYAPNANNKLLVQDRVTDPASVAKAAFGATMEVIVSSANWSGGNMRGFYGGVSWDGSTRDFNNGSVLLGLEGGVTTYSMVAGRTVRSQIGLFGTNSISGTGGTVTTATGISHYASVSGGVTVTTYNIFNPSTFAPSGGSTIGTLVGYRVPVQTGGTANFDMLFDTTAGAFWREAGNKIYSSAAATLDIDTTTTFNHRIGGTVKLALTSSTLTFSDAVNIAVNTTTGTKIGTATTQKLGFWNATPIVQPTTASGSATFVANAGTAVNDASTFDGYTLKQVVKALRDEGLLQ